MITVVGAFASITGDVMAAVESRVMPNEPNTMVNPAKTSSIVVIAFANLSFCSKAFYNLVFALKLLGPLLLGLRPSIL